MPTQTLAVILRVRIHPDALAPSSRKAARSRQHRLVVIPAQAGIQGSVPHCRKIRLDPGLRRHDEP
jgi:hypothetical protein